MEDTKQVADRFVTDIVEDGVGIKTDAFKDRLTDLITEERLKAIGEYQKPSREEREQCWPHGGGNPQLPQWASL